MHHYRQPEPLAAERIRGRLAEAEESRPAHRARTDSRAADDSRKGPSKQEGTAPYSWPVGDA